MTFIKQQQELAIKKFRKEFWKLSGDSAGELERKQDEYIDTLIQQIIHNTGEELMRLAKGEKGYLAHSYKAVGREGKFIAEDTTKQHITSVTGVE